MRCYQPLLWVSVKCGSQHLILISVSPLGLGSPWLSWVMLALGSLGRGRCEQLLSHLGAGSCRHIRSVLLGCRGGQQVPGDTET